MNSNGDIYQGPKRDKDDIELDGVVAMALGELNRKGRRAFYAEKRHGKSDSDAMDAARDAHCGGRNKS